MNYIQLNFQIHWHTKNRPYLGNYNRQRGAVTCKMFVAKKYLNNLFCAKALTLIVFELFYDKAPRQPPPPQKKLFFWKNGIFRPVFHPKTLIFEYVTQNNHRKLLAKAGWKNINPFNFWLFSKYKNGPKPATFRPIMSIFGTIPSHEYREASCQILWQ